MVYIDGRKVRIMIVAFISMALWLSVLSNGTSWLSFIIIASHWTIASVVINKAWLNKSYYGSLALFLIIAEMFLSLFGKFNWVVVVAFFIWIAIRSSQQQIMKDATDNLFKVIKEQREKRK